MSDYYTRSEIKIMTAAYEFFVASGWDEAEAWAVSYEVLSMQKGDVL